MSMDDLKDEIHRLQRDVNEVKAIVKKIGLEVPERKVSDEEAERDLIRYVKQVGKSETSSFEVSLGLNIPVEQVERIFDKLEKEGKIKDVEE